jgi:hypothetical protein
LFDAARSNCIVVNPKGLKALIIFSALCPAAIGYNRMGMAFGDLRERMSRYIAT